MPVEQLSLIPGEPVYIAPEDPRVTAIEAPRLSRQSAAILERLKCGPARNTELLQIAIRYGARIGDLRAAGHRITTEQNRATGVTVYTLQTAAVDTQEGA